MTIAGRACLKLYKNKACTRELTFNGSNEYTLDVPVLSANAQSPYQAIIWIRNDGDHKAYDCNVALVSSTLPNTTVTTAVTNNLTMLPNEVKRCAVNLPITQGQTGTYTVVLNVHYDSI